MPAVPDSIKTVLSGVLPGGEVFAHSQWWDGSGIVGNVTDEDNVAGNVVGSLTGNLLTTAVRALFTTAVSWTNVTHYFYGSSGVLARTLITPVSVAGTAATGQLPPQCATVVSLRTGAAGRANRGRTYFPAFAAANLSGNTGQWNSTVPGTLANAYKAFLDGVNSLSPNPVPIVMSLSQGAKVPLVTVEVDSRVDTQRRRSQQLIVTTKAVAVL